MAKKKKDVYYGPEKYKGDLLLMKKLNPKLYKKYRKKYKGRYIGPDKYKGKKPKSNPSKAKPAIKTVKPQEYEIVGLSGFKDQTVELLNAYMAIAGIELYQYVNTATIDGAYSDVAIINVLSRLRQQYTPNRIIEQAVTWIKKAWIQDGRLFMDITDGGGFDEVALAVNVWPDLTIFAETVD